MMTIMKSRRTQQLEKSMSPAAIRIVEDARLILTLKNQKDTDHTFTHTGKKVRN